VNAVSIVVGAVAVCRLHSARITDPEFFAIGRRPAGWSATGCHTSEAPPPCPCR
jgi:hypothetical protein